MISWIDLGLIHSSAAKTLVDLYVQQLKHKDIITSIVSPNFLFKNWPPAFVEWSTKSVRDAFFASPQFPRLLSSDAIKDAISKGVSNEIFAYVGKSAEGKYKPIYSKTGLPKEYVEISEDWFIVKEPIDQFDNLHTIVVSPSQISIKPVDEIKFTAQGLSEQGQETKIDQLKWSATGGTISDLGVFRAGTVEGTYSVIATSGDVKGSGSIAIVAVGPSLNRIAISPQDSYIGPGKTQNFTAKGFDKDGHEVPLDKIKWSAIGGTVDDNGIYQSGQEQGIFKITATVKDITGIATITVKKRSSHWEGEIPHQKWTQFYNRVLLKFAVRKGLTLTLAVNISDTSEEEVEEMKAALRELGLCDDIETN